MQEKQLRLGRRRKRGSYFIEFTLSFLPLFALVMAIIDFSLPLFVRSAFTNAVREGVRYAATYRTLPGKNHVESIKTIVARNSAGFIDQSNGLSKVKVRFYEPVNFTEVTGGVKNADGNVVEVSIEGYTWHWLAPLGRASNPLVYNIRAAERLETLPASATRPLAP